jgi:hypothetical protein
MGLITRSRVLLFGMFTELGYVCMKRLLVQLQETFCVRNSASSQPK